MHNEKSLPSLIKDRMGISLFILVLIISAAIHGWNMFGFPYYENDEGVYMSQAWSLVHQGELAPYTYWYDHAPAGWIFIALWTLVSGGFFTFGMSLNSGRVMMLILHVASTLLLMLITRKITKNNFAAVFAGLLFSISPLGIYFQRRVLLDNIMTFWILLSYFWLIKNKLTITSVLVSALFFGIAVLTKENAIFFGPGFVLTIFALSHKYHRYLAILKWLIVSGSVVSIYFLFALLKGELFPPGTFGDSGDHVSLIGTLQYQSSREGGSVFEIESSSFWQQFFAWFRQDPFIIVYGVVSTLLVALFSIIKKNLLLLAITFNSLFFWLFLMRGGIVMEFYFVPLIPWLALLIALVVDEISKRVAKHQLTQYAFFSGMLLVLSVHSVILMRKSYVYGSESTAYYLFESQQTKAQLDAINWIRKNVDPSNTIVIDNYAYIDLKDPASGADVTFPEAEWYWKVDQDVEVRKYKLNNQPSNIELLAVTPQMTGDLRQGASAMSTTALNRSQPWKIFESDGWNVQFWRPYYPQQLLNRSWESYKEHFIVDGQVIDYSRNLTTSEGQSYALLRAVWLNDKEAFDVVLEWTNNNLRNENNLFTWHYPLEGSETKRSASTQSAADADQDIALALLFAYKKWGEDRYLNQAEQVINGIWQYEVKEMNGEYYILPGPWAVNKPGVYSNPSYYAPYAYQIFAEVDPEHDWQSVIDTSFDVLNTCSEASLGIENPVFLPPEWCLYANDGTASVIDEEGLQATEYSYNSFRVPWKVATYYLWYEDKRAKEYLEKLDFLEQEWREKNKIVVAYTHDGKEWEKYESVAAYGANLGYFKVIKPELSETIYKTHLEQKFYENETESYWDVTDNYYSQNWAWFGTALQNDLLPNLWEEKN